MKLLLIASLFASLAFMKASASPVDGEKILDCLTNPCLTVPGVGKLKGTKKVRKLNNTWAVAVAKPRVSLTAPYCDHFAWVSLTVLDNFLDAIAKAKKLIRESIAQNLKQVSLTKSFLALAMAFNLFLSNLT